MIKPAACLALLVNGLFLLGALSECDLDRVRTEQRGNDWFMPIGGIGEPVEPPEISRDGRYVVFEDGHEVYSVETDGVKLHVIGDGPSADPFFEQEAEPDLSPDGTRVAYSTFRYWTGFPWNEIHSWEIATANIDGSDAKRLTRDIHRNRAPVWSPDGSQIAFVSRRDSRTAEVRTMAADGSNEQRIAFGGYESYIDPRLIWSPDGRHIAFRDFDRGWREGLSVADQHFIAVVRPDGSEFKRVIESDLWLSEPAWSPDGKYLAFVDVEGDSTNLNVIGLDDLNIRRVLAVSWPNVTKESSAYAHLSRPYVFPLSWSPDGSEIRFMTYDTRIRLRSVRPDGTGFRTLIEELGARHEWYPDGSRIVVRGRPSSEDLDVVLYSMNVDGTDVRILVRKAYGRFLAENSGWRDEAPTCSSGEAVIDPLSNPGLVKDCETLLRIHDVLNPDGVNLVWLTHWRIEAWRGVTVGGSPARVEGLEFDSNTLPYNNYLRGSIPAGIRDLDGLKRIKLNGQQLTGEIPPELTSLKGLKVLDLSANGLSGRIPPELANLDELEILNLSRNRFTVNIPPQLGRLSKLKELRLNSNRLIGPIPPEFGNLNELTSLSLHDTGLSGQVPQEIGNLSKLTSLSLPMPHLSGCIPAALSDNPNLKINSHLKPC